ncbi:hypothetical protein LBMAG56_18190 [Verrucomicrobiota bacterium]|nr:hypothetical protein LBMAG56_18190 [Verrucomicrobiota bacterium]
MKPQSAETEHGGPTVVWVAEGTLAGGSRNHRGLGAKSNGRGVATARRHKSGGDKLSPPRHSLPAPRGARPLGDAGENNLSK